MVLGLLKVRQPERNRDQIRDELPFLVGEVGGVGSAIGATGHAHAAPNTTSCTKGPRNPWNTLYAMLGWLIFLAAPRRTTPTTLSRRSIAKIVATAACLYAAYNWP